MGWFNHQLDLDVFVCSKGVFQVGFGIGDTVSSLNCLVNCKSTRHKPLKYDAWKIFFGWQPRLFL